MASHQIVAKGAVCSALFTGRKVSSIELTPKGVVLLVFSTGHEVSSADAATLHADILMLFMQAIKSQALTLLASWVVAEPSLAVANKLHQQDLPNRILEDLVNRAHEYLPGPAAGAAVQVPVPSSLLLPTAFAFWLHVSCLLSAF